MQSKDVRIFSFFSGSGFLDLGFEKNGFQVALVNERMPSFMNAYRHSRAGMGMDEPEYGHLTASIQDFLGERADEMSARVRDARRDGAAVGFIGGPPCPDFSIAGKNRGREGDNGRLSQSYVDLILRNRPEFFLFENVKGLWKTARHRAFFDELKASLREAGYRTTERLVNALEYGAPQDRDRILMIGMLRDIAGDGDPADPHALDFPWAHARRHELSAVKALPWPGTAAFAEGSVSDCPAGVIEALTVEHWFRRNRVGEHPNAGDHFTPRAGLHRMQTVEEGDTSRKSYKRLHRWRYSPTVAYGNNEVHLHPYRARRLSAAEALSLQTLPPEFALPASMSLCDVNYFVRSATIKMAGM